MVYRPRQASNFVTHRANGAQSVVFKCDKVVGWNRLDGADAFIDKKAKGLALRERTAYPLAIELNSDSSTDDPQEPTSLKPHWKEDCCAATFTSQLASKETDKINFHRFNGITLARSMNECRMSKDEKVNGVRTGRCMLDVGGNLPKPFTPSCVALGNAVAIDAVPS
jgi:hypothetical protein